MPPAGEPAGRSSAGGDRTQDPQPMESAADASAASAGSDQKAPSTRLGSGRADSALLQRQCYGRLSPSVLHMESLAYQPIDYLTLDYCSNSAVGKLAYSGDPYRPLLAVGSFNSFGLSVWRHSFGSDRPCKVLCLNELHTRPITDISWLNPGDDPSTLGADGLLVTCSEDGTACVVSVGDRSVVARTDLRAVILSAAQADRNSVVLSYGSQWGLWDRRSAVLAVGGAKDAESEILSDLACLWETGLVFSASLSGKVKVWDVRKGAGSSQCLASVQARREDEGVSSLSVHSDNTSLLVGCEGGVIYDTNLQQLLHDGNSAGSLSLSPSSPFVRHHYTGHSNHYNLKRAQRSADGRYVMCGSDDGSVHVWHAGTGGAARRLDGSAATTVISAHATTMPVLSAALSPTHSRYQLAFCTDTASFLFSHREGADGRVSGEVEVQLLDDSLAEEAGEEQNATLLAEDDDEEEDQAWEEDHLGLQDKECSYGRGYVQQLVYVCDTCAGHARERGGDASLMHGLCVQCAAHCHEFIGHSVRNIGEKKGFRCDCGNACFRQAGRLGGQLRCTLRAEGERRDETNAGNAYNHNFMDRWCYCDGAEVLPMHQCIDCKDWFHPSCMHEGYDWTKDEFLVEDYICQACLAKPELSCLRKYPSKSLADRPCFRPAAQQQQQPQQQQEAATEEAAASGPVVGGAAEAMDVVAEQAPPASSTTSAAQQPDGNDEEDDSVPRCHRCRGKAVADVPCMALLRCAGPTARGGGAALKSTGEEEEAAPECQNTYFHPACLPPGAAEVDHLGRWFCKSCSGDEEQEEEEADLSTRDVDPSLPVLGWRMHRGRFVEQGWDALLQEQDREAVKRALGTVEPPRTIERTVSTGAAAVAAAINQQQQQQAQPAQAVAVAGGGGGGEEEEDDLNAQIREAVMAGDEAKAFRLAMQKILTTAIEDANSSRRRCILAQDVQRAAQQMREQVSSARQR